MASIWFAFSKLFQCIEIILNSGKATKGIITSENHSRRLLCRNLKKKSFLTAFSLCGFSGFREKKSKTDSTEDVVHNVALATIALKDGNYEKSEKMLMKSLDLAENSNFSLGVISACDLLSSLAMKAGDYERAEDLLIRALDNLLMQGAPADDNFVVSFNLKLSRIYSSNGNDDLAELGFKNCLHLQRKKLEKSADEETSLLWTTILYWYGKFLLDKNRFQEAKTCFLDCYQTSQKLKDLLPSQVMVILYNLSEVCQILGEHDEAFKHLLTGVSLDKKRKNPDLTYFYTKLGTISLCKGMYKEAKIWCDQGQKYAVRYQNSDAQKESNECLAKLQNILTA